MKAMASGVPVVGTDVGDCRWLIGNDDFIAKPRDPQAQAAQISRIFALDAEDRRRLGISGRMRVMEHFSLQKYTESHIRLYEAALDIQQQHFRGAA